MSAPIVQVEHLHKHYGPLKALDDVSLEIRRGEIFGLLGPNGAGKTTLIGVVAGLVRRTSGLVRVDGFDVSDDYLQARRLIGLVPQEINFDPFFTVEEILRFQAGFFGVRLSEEKLVELLGAMGLLDKRRENTRALSGGMKRRLLIAKALVHEPQVLFLDEPTAGVDVELRRDLWNYVRSLRARGTTIVLTTHYLEEAEELADRIGIIDRGQVRLVEQTQELLARLGSRTLTLWLSKPAQALPPALTALGARLTDDGSGVVFIDRPTEDLGPRIEAAIAAGLSIRDVDLRQTRLEEVFIRLLNEPCP